MAVSGTGRRAARRPARLVGAAHTPSCAPDGGRRLGQGPPWDSGWARPSCLLSPRGRRLWHIAVRPFEEADRPTASRRYERYRRAVRCWLPSMRPYRARRGSAAEPAEVRENSLTDPVRGYS